jgi:hypothetical protein
MTLPKEEIIYGTDTHPKPEEHNNLKKVLKILFQKEHKTKKS